MVKQLALFGGDKPWSPVDWTDSDDRVRGGSSRSYLDCSPFESVARFHGELDIKTLGGAGFASQRTTGEEHKWDVSGYDGIQLEIEKSDDKTYTFVLKDEILEKDPNTGREQSTISWEYDFSSKNESAAGTRTIFIPWKSLKPTYRGKEKNDADPLNRKAIKRFSLLMRSHFGKQEGSFSLSVRSISAVSKKGSKEESILGRQSAGNDKPMPVPRNPRTATDANILKYLSIRNVIIAGGIFIAAYIIFM